MNDFSCMSWEPRILKHPARFDNPWDYDYDNYHEAQNRRQAITGKSHASVARRKPVLMYDSQTLKMTDYVSYAEAARDISADPGQILQAVRNGWYVGKRYICGYTIQQLFDNMAKHGLT